MCVCVYRASCCTVPQRSRLSLPVSACHSAACSPAPQTASAKRHGGGDTPPCRPLSLPRGSSARDSAPQSSRQEHPPTPRTGLRCEADADAHAARDEEREGASVRAVLLTAHALAQHLSQPTDVVNVCAGGQLCEGERTLICARGTSSCIELRIFLCSPNSTFFSRSSCRCVAAARCTCRRMRVCVCACVCG